MARRRFKLSDRARRRKAARSIGIGRHGGQHPGGRNQPIVHRFSAPVYRASPGYTAGSSRRVAVGHLYPPHPAGLRGSPGYSAGTTRRLQVGKRVPPPGVPHGYLGGRGYGVGYRYPGSRPVRVAGSGLADLGDAQCVPCSEAARMARG